MVLVVFTTSKAAPEERKSLVISKIDNSKVLFASYKKEKKKKEKCLDPNLFCFCFYYPLHLYLTGRPYLGRRESLPKPRYIV